MQTISLIAAVDEQGGLGKNNQLLCHLPADLQHFKALTMGKPIIMGRHTYESIGKPLPGRLNIVLSNSASSIAGVTVLDSLEKITATTKDYPEIMIIGGAQIYKQTITMASCIYLTTIKATFAADVFFPVIDKKVWFCESAIEHKRDEKNSYDMIFSIYKRRKSNQDEY